jgi:alkanesulfonate monooxygenase SsuD/methylene tetrahydromethanopterin reductase-like flavin-dependent oxidoreductase (luciferase family)
MKAMWTQDESEYHGEMVDLGPTWCWPKPVQKPYPPVLLGGSGPSVLKRVVAYADGWMPNRGDDLDRIAELQELARAAGRGRMDISTYPKAEAAVLQEHAKAGVDRCIFYVPPDGRDQALKRLEELAVLVKPFAD